MTVRKLKSMVADIMAEFPNVSEYDAIGWAIKMYNAELYADANVVGNNAPANTPSALEKISMELGRIADAISQHE